MSRFKFGFGFYDLPYLITEKFLFDWFQLMEIVEEVDEDGSGTIDFDGEKVAATSF